MRNPIYIKWNRSRHWKATHLVFVSRSGSAWQELEYQKFKHTSRWKNTFAKKSIEKGMRLFWGDQ